VTDPGRILALRPYQRDALDAVWASVYEGGRGLRRPAVVLPTAAGKTVVFAHMAKEWLEWLDVLPGRVLVLVHTVELLEQAVAKFAAVAPGLRVGVMTAGRWETLPRVIVATVQTLRDERRRRMLRDVSLIVVDECHHATAATYRTILEHYGCFERNGALAVGFTATMVRADSAALGDIWQDVVYTRSIAEMIHEGYLVRPRGVHVQVDDLDLSKVRTSGGDFREGELGEAIEASMAPTAVAKAITEHADERRILLFAPTVSSATVIGDAIESSGRSVGLIHGGLPPGERRAVLDRFRSGQTQVLSGCMVLTEGFDEPAADCVVIARPTKSQGLFTQIVGRVLRPFPGKSEALVLDVVGASRLHGLHTVVSLFGQATKDAVEGELGEDLDDEGLDAASGLGLADDEVYRDGPLVSVEVDLFHSSPMAWLRTRAGVWFIAAGERYIAILPGFKPGTYDVTAMHKDRVGTGVWVATGIADLSYAMAWAEGEVTSGEKMIATKERSWRAKPPSDKMRAFASRLRIIVPDGARSGEVSNLITLSLASGRIDPHLPAWAFRR